MRNHKFFIGLLAATLAATATQVAEPVLNYEVTGDELILTYSGTLLQSTDAVNWAEVASASSPYKVKISDKKLFFCAKDGSESKSITIPLSDTVNLDMIWVEPGTFMMGSPSDELGRDEGEIQHEVTLTKGYWLGKYEVTQAQYKAVMGKNPSYFWLGDDWPVEQVSRNEAMEFCAKLTAIEKAAGRLPWGYEYSLPTEAQWEYACRAGTTTALNSGKNLSDMYKCPEMDEVGWYDDNNYGMTSMVGQKLPNAWGFYDMHGNVFEWCLDWYNSDYYENSPESDPVDLRESNTCVRRGGSYARYSAICRSANRAAFGSGGGMDKETGFRMALVSKDMSVPLSKDVDLRMIWVEPGTFLMGSPKGELGGYTVEVQHEVTLTKGYWLGKYEVTQEQYKAVMGYNPSYFKEVDHPVEYVTWERAMEFCAKLTAIERKAGRLPQGYVYSLPTSAQWEYACRAGTTTALNSGKNLSDVNQCPEMDEVGWYRYNSGEYDADGKDTNKGTHYPVGQKLPNAWGFYDMHGNVEEWCVDKSGEKYTDTAVTDPVTLVGTSSVVIRGGDYRYSTARDCRSAYRTGIDSIYGGAYIGFRVALVREMVIPLYPRSTYVNLDMIWIDPGTFTMGSPEDELGRYDSEVQHEVTLTQGYWMGRHEITQAQYHAVMRTNPSYFTNNKIVEARMLPVEQVSWYDAMEFCAKLTAIEREAGRLPEGYEYTLPTEAQWEYACRAGTTTALYSGKDLTGIEVCPNVDELGWYANNSDNKTHDVGQKLPNAWGLYDMYGNVYEWCLDWYGYYPTTAVIDPRGPDTGIFRILHGGRATGEARRCRSAYRNSANPEAILNSFGFRVVLAEIPPVPVGDMTIPLSTDVSLDMVWIEPGTFMMGSPENELGRSVLSIETQHEVTLTEGYWLGKYEVTQAQYETIMGMNPSKWKGSNLPVECVSWEDATNFCAKLTAIERKIGRLPRGYEYTLPTEAQWEYACRAGTTTALYSGKDLTDMDICPNVDELGWYEHNSNQTTHSVGQKLPNAWGLYDISGNVYEWCLDWYGDYPTSAVDPTGPDTGSGRVIRGGSWYYGANGCRSAARGYEYPGNNKSNYGIRVALVPVQ